MNKILQISYITILMSSLICAGGYIENKNIDTIKNQAQNNARTLYKNLLLYKPGKLISTYGVGVSKITLGRHFHKAIVITSKKGYTFDNKVNGYIFSESNYYRHLGDIHDMGLSGIGLEYKMNTFSIGAVAGLGMNINYSKITKKFRDSYDFGFTYRINMTYTLNEKLDLNIFYSKFYFNTNATNLEDKNPDIIGINIFYKF